MVYIAKICGEELEIKDLKVRKKIFEMINLIAQNQTYGEK